MEVVQYSHRLVGQTVCFVYVDVVRIYIYEQLDVAYGSCPDYLLEGL
jgi:hypothetical protein